MSRLRAELQEIRAVALDLDGVLYDVDNPIPGAVQAVGDLRAAGMPVRFVTNTTSLSRRQIVQKLERLGFQAEIGEVFCPARGGCRLALAPGIHGVLVRSGTGVGGLRGRESRQRSTRAPCLLRPC